MNSRFDGVDRKFESVERFLEMIEGSTHDIARLEARE